MRKVLFVILILLLIFIVTGCQPKKNDSLNVNVNSSFTFDISKKDGKTVIVHIGDILVLSLVSNSKAGYEWHYAGPLGNELELKDHQVKSLFDKELMGGDILSKWEFIVSQEGEFELKFNYAKGWEEKIAKTFKVQIESKQAR